MIKNLPMAIVSMFLACPSLSAHADDLLKPEQELTFNAALTSDYRYRGISQTRLQPALQGGADYAHNPTGFYAGTWLSTITWTKDAAGGGDIEWDLYAGRRGPLGKELAYDVGVLTYVYPSNRLAQVAGLANANTTEIYGQLAAGPGYAKYSYAVTNLFGFSDSRHSGYLDLGANVEAGAGWTVNLHAGHQTVKHTSAASYSDWKLGLSRDLGAATLAVAAVGTNASESAYASPANGRFLGKRAVVVTLSKTF